MANPVRRVRLLGATRTAVTREGLVGASGTPCRVRLAPRPVRPIRLAFVGGLASPQQHLRSHPDPRQRGAGPVGAAKPLPFAPGFWDLLEELLRPPAHIAVGKLQLPEPLYPFQRVGAAFLYKRTGALLADEMGLGKTVQAIAAAGLLIASGQAHEVLVVCPNAVAAYWPAMISRWLPGLPVQPVRVVGPRDERRRLWRRYSPFKVVGYEVLRSDVQAGILPNQPWDLVILDEAQRIKNRDTEMARVCKALRRKRGWALTGTPLENSVDDLASVLEFVCGRHIPVTEYLWGMPELRAVQQSHQLRRKKEDVFSDLPPKTVTDVVLDMDPAQAATYYDLEREGRLRLQTMGSAVTLEHALAVLQYLKQICNFCPRSGASPKLEHLTEALREALDNGRSCLVFSQWVQPPAGVLRLQHELADFRPIVYCGGMSGSQREQAIQRFKEQPDPALLILSLKAGGVGLDLPRASYVCHFDRWWNPAVERQAEDRAHRLSQRLPVTVHRLIMRGTVEERIHAILAQKERLFEDVVDGAPKPVLTESEIFGLLGVERPRRAKQGVDNA